MKGIRLLAPWSWPIIAVIGCLGLVVTVGLSWPEPGHWQGRAAENESFAVVSISPNDGETGVSTSATITATFSLPLVSGTVNTYTFQVTEENGNPVLGDVTVAGYEAFFTPQEALPANTTFQVLIVGGSDGVAGDLGSYYYDYLDEDFTSTFVTGGSGAGGEATIAPEQGGTASDPQTGAAIIIPPHTLKGSTTVNVLTLNSRDQIGQVDNNCGVPIQPRDVLPGVPGFDQVTEIVRYEATPCGAVTFGPGARLLLPVLRSRFPLGFPIGDPRPLRLFELVRLNRRLVFLDTGIPAKVTPENSRSPAFGDFVTIPDIQVFGTFAVFTPSNSLHRSPRTRQPAQQIELADTAQQASLGRLFFPIVSQINGRQTRISIANPDTMTALNVMFTAYRENGALVGTQLRTVDVNRQASYLISSLFPNLTSGAIVAERLSGRAMTGFSEISDNFGTPGMLGGTEGIQRPQSTLVFPVVRSSAQAFTEVHVFNPNPSSVSLTVSGYTATGARVAATNPGGQPLGSVTLAPFAKIIVSSQGSPSQVQLNFGRLDGGYIFVQAIGGPLVTGGEISGELIFGQMSLALLNSLPFPTGCLISASDPGGCHVDTPGMSSVPSALHQHTLYAGYFETNPAQSTLYLVNASDSPAALAFSAFSELGQFRGAFPPTGFLTIGPHQVFQAAVSELFGFNPSPGYIRVEDQNSTFVGGLMNRNTSSSRFVSLIPLVPDDPRLAQIATTTFFSRVQLDPANSNPRQTTGMLILNPNNNPVQFRINLVDSAGRIQQSSVQTLVARGMFTRVQQSLITLFPNLNLSSGFANLLVTTVLEPGMGGRLIPTAAYRLPNVVSTVSSQDSQP